MADTLEERRHFPRIKLSCPLRYQIRGLPNVNSTLIDNIGPGGLGFISDEFIAPKTLVMLEMSILSRVLRPIGKIAWSSPAPHSDRYWSGVEFLVLDSTEKKYLQDYINMQRGEF